MPKRCKSIAGQRLTLGPGEIIIEGCELIGGSGIFSTGEEYPFQFVQEDGVAGDDGAVVIWPDTGNDLYRFDEGETVLAGTTLHNGCVMEDGELKCAPYTTQQDAVATGGSSEGDTSGENDDGKDKGFCVGSGNVNKPTEDDLEWLTELANYEIPDLEAWLLSGFTAKIQEMMGKLNQMLGKLQGEVDKIISKATINPEDVCTPPVKETIRRLLSVMNEIMKLLPIMRQIIKIIKIIQKVIKLVRKILKWTPPFIVPIVEKLMQVLNIVGLVDMAVSMLLKTIGRFTAIIPILQAQLMAILAQCAAQAGQPPPDTKEACEAAGGTWIDPDELKNLQNMYDQISSESEGLISDDVSVGFCSITEHLDKQSCEAAGGLWTDLDVDTNFDDVDTSTLSKELALQLEELSRCFSNPELKEYLDEL